MTRQVRERALFVNFNPYSIFIRNGRSLLPTAEVDIHLITRNRAWGGVQGVDPKDFAAVTVVDARYESQWRAACAWILDTAPFTRVMAVHERAVLYAGELRSTYGLAGTDFATAERFRDKVVMKRAVAAADAAPVPEFAPLDAPGDLDALDWRAGRWVIKSRWGLGASDVHVVDSLDAARRVCADLDLSDSQYEVERFVEGEIYHCDAVVQDGAVRFANVARYIANPAGFEPGSAFGSVTVLGGALYDRIRALNERVLAALGIQESVTHLELFHTPDDRLVFCEVAARPPGGLVSHVVERQFGFNMLETSLRQQAGVPVRLPSQEAPAGGGGHGAHGVHGWVGFYPEQGVRRGLTPELSERLGVVEHLHSDTGGDGKGGVRHSTDFADSYVVRAADEAALRRTIQDIEAEYRGSAR